MKTKKQLIKEHLSFHKTIESMEAFKKYGVTRLSAIIFDLRDEGYKIETKMNTKVDKNGNACNYATYVFRGLTKKSK